MNEGALQKYVIQCLLSALGGDEDSYNGGYTVEVRIDGDYGYIDWIPKMPSRIAIGTEINRKISEILSGALYPYYSLIVSDGPEFVSTDSNNINNARALRFHFKVGTYRRLKVEKNSILGIENNVMPLMDGYGYNPDHGSGMIALSGASGTKTTLAIFILDWFYYVKSAEIHIIDPRLDLGLYGFAKSIDCEYVYPKIEDNSTQFENDAYAILANALGEIGRRQQLILDNPNIELPPYIVFVDEAAAFSNKKTKAIMERIILMGRACRVSMIVSAQGFDASTVLSSTARDSFALRVVLSNNPSVEDCRYLLKGFDPTSVVIPNDGFNFGRGLIQNISTDGRVVPFLAPLIV